MTEKEELNIVTEVGVFGSLDIDDPTKKKIKKKNGQDEDVKGLIQEAIQENMTNLPK